MSRSQAKRPLSKIGWLVILYGFYDTISGLPIENPKIKPTMKATNIKIRMVCMSRVNICNLLLL